MSEAPLISVCIANYNGLALIEACIESVVAQDCDCRVEILVHDDASTDASADFIAQRYNQAQLLRSAENVGFCVANNRLAAAARGEYLLLLNNDATLCPDALSKLVEEAQRLGRPAILSLPQYDVASGELIDIGCRLDPFFNPVANRDPRLGDVGMVIGACLWIDKALWNELGGFPPWFGSIGEDLYLCCRARLADYPVRALAASGYWHHVGKSFGGGKPQAGRLATTVRRRALSERNKTFTMAMTCPAPHVYLILALHLILLLFEGLVLSSLLRQPALLKEIYLPVFAALWRQRKLLRHERRSAMQERRARACEFFSAFDPLPHKLRLLFRYGLPTLEK